MYSIKVADARYKFSASHFLVLNEGHKCSRLHGHNYTVNLSISGELDENCFVVDFMDVKQQLQELVEQLDHFVLIPTKSDKINVTTEGEEVLIETPFKKYILPKGDICFLPLPATTSELLAKYIHDQLKPAFPSYQLKVTVGETNTTTATYQESKL